MRIALLLFILPLLMISCRKSLPEAVNFDVTADQLTVNAGSPVTFSFNNAPETMTFYSGETGHEYRYRDRDTLSGLVHLTFTSLVLNSTGNNLSLLISSDLGSPVDTNSIRSATWTDITDRAVISKGVDNTPSGTIDLSDFNANAAKIAIAYRYTDVTRSNSQSIVYVREVQLTKETADGAVYNLLNLADGKWKAVNFLNPSAVWSINSTRLYINGGNASSASNEDWVVSRTIDLKSIKKDAGVAIKNIVKNLTTYSHVFPEPGTYVVTFVGMNNYGQESQQQVKELTITVMP